MSGGAAKAIVARSDGDNYQRLVLWYYIGKMLCESDIEKIYFEYDEIKSFDDIVLVYKEPLIHQGKRIIEKEYIQVKFRKCQSDFISFKNLMNPSFINASEDSFFQKLKNAYDKLGEKYKSSLFILYTTLEFDQNDPLYKYISKKDGTIDVEKFIDKTKRTDRAKCREKLCEHLDVDTKELKEILAQIKFHKGPTLEALKDQINILLKSNKLKLISKMSIQNIYLDLAKNWLERGVKEITPSFVLNECKEEGLICLDEKNIKYIAIKTVEKNTNNLKEDGIDTLDLSEKFKEGKYLKKEHTWENLRSDIENYIGGKSTRNTYAIHLPCSLSVAFLCGRILNTKSGYHTYPMQKTDEGIVPWGKNLNEKEKENYEDIFINTETLEEKSLETIVMISITHDVEIDVQEYIKQNDIKISKIYHFKHKNLGRNAILNGFQCAIIAKKIAQTLGSRQRCEKKNKTHFFVAAPNALMFYFGKHSLNVGRLVLYEHDIKSEKKQAYEKSVEVPMKGE